MTLLGRTTSLWQTAIFLPLLWTATTAPSALAAGRTSMRNLASNDKLACTIQSITRFRKSEFRRAFEKKQYQKAADLLEAYIDSRDCFEKLIHQEKRPAEVGPALNYLWALVDISLARLKAADYAECISITRGVLDEYGNREYKNPADKKVYTALKANRDSCDKARLAGLQEVPAKTPSCQFKWNSANVVLSGLGEDTDEVHSLKIAKVKFSTLIPGTTSCAALIYAAAPATLFDKDEDDPDIEIPLWVIGEKTPQGLDIQVIDAMNASHSTDGFWCGDFEVIPYQNEQKATILRLKGGFGYCHGGTAVGIYDSLWGVHPRLHKKDEVDVLIH